MAARSYPQRLKKKWNSKQIKTIKNENSKIFAIPSAKHFSIIFVLLLLLFLVICAPVSLLLINYVCKRGTSARASENGKGMNKRDLWWCEMMIIIGESVSTENFPPEFKRVWWFFMWLPPLFIWSAYHFTLPFHFMSVICVYVCGTHVKWKANTALNAKQRIFYSIVTNVRVRVWAFKRKREYAKEYAISNQIFRVRNIYIRVRCVCVCRNGNGLIHFGIWSRYRYFVCMILCVINFVFAARCHLQI